MQIQDFAEQLMASILACCATSKVVISDTKCRAPTMQDYLPLPSASDRRQPIESPDDPKQSPVDRATWLGAIAAW